MPRHAQVCGAVFNNVTNKASKQPLLVTLLDTLLDSSYPHPTGARWGKHNSYRTGGGNKTSPPEVRFFFAIFSAGGRNFFPPFSAGGEIFFGPLIGHLLVNYW